MPNPKEDTAEVIIEAILRVIWDFRVELVFAGTFGTFVYLASHVLGEGPAWLAQAVVISLVLSIGPVRRSVGRRLRHARVRRQWARAVQAARIVSLEGRVPTVHKMKDIPAGERFEVRVPRGSSVPACRPGTRR